MSAQLLFRPKRISTIDSSLTVIYVFLGKDKNVRFWYRTWIKLITLSEKNTRKGDIFGLRRKQPFEDINDKEFHLRMCIVILTRILANFHGNNFITSQTTVTCNGSFFPFLAGFLLVMSSFVQSEC